MSNIIGTVRAPGVSVREAETSNTIAPGALGWAAMIGTFARGVPGRAEFITSRVAAQQRLGGRADRYMSRQAVQDYFDESNGAGGIVAIRITDGTETRGEIELKTRGRNGQTLGVLRAKSGGRWAGFSDQVHALVPSAGSISSTSVSTGASDWQTDQWVGAKFFLWDVKNRSYDVIGSTDDGILLFDADVDIAADYLEAGGGNLHYDLVLRDNASERFSIVIDDSPQGQPDEFSIQLFEDGVPINAGDWSRLSIDRESPFYWEQLINESGSNFYLEAEDTFTGQRIASARPANIYTDQVQLNQESVRVQLSRMNQTVGDATPLFTLGPVSSAMVPQRLRLSMTSATAFTVFSDEAGGLGNGTVGVTFTPFTKLAPQFVVANGDTVLEAGDIFDIFFEPLNADDLTGGFLYPDKVGQPNLRYRIVSNTHDTINVQPGSTMQTDIGVVTALAATAIITVVATADLVAGESFTITDASLASETFYYDISGSDVGFGTAIDISADTTAEEVAITTAAAISSSSNIAVTASSSADALALTQDQAGASGNTQITNTVTSTGFMATNFTNGRDATATEIMVAAQQKLQGGTDGDANVVDSDYVRQMDVVTSPIRQIQRRSIGLIKVTCPGVSSLTVHRAGWNFAAAHSYQYRATIPQSLSQSPEILAFLDDVGRSEFLVANDKSWAYISDPDARTPGALRLVDTVGMVLGEEARITRSVDGYHKAQAGTRAVLTRIVRLLHEEENDLEFLEPQGVNTILRKDSGYVIWGNKTRSSNPRTQAKHARELQSYYTRIMVEQFDFAIFEISDDTLYDSIRSALYSFFNPEYTKGALDGNLSIQEALVIKIDAENNPQEVRERGDVSADLELALATSAERLRLNVSRRGVTQSQS